MFFYYFACSELLPKVKIWTVRPSENLFSSHFWSQNVFCGLFIRKILGDLEKYTFFKVLFGSIISKIWNTTKWGSHLTLFLLFINKNDGDL
jgi:hypothetical protein